MTKKEDVSLVKDLARKTNKQDKRKKYRKDGTICSDELENVLGSFLPKA